MIIMMATLKRCVNFLSLIFINNNNDNDDDGIIETLSKTLIANF